MRKERLEAELENLRLLRKASSIFDFSSNDPPPDRYQLIFRGKGWREGGHRAGKKVELQEQHECELRLPYSFPQRPPDVRWISPIFHPNISYGGFLQLEEVGLVWESQMSLDVVCERLWDLARFAYFDLEHASNYRARQVWQSIQDDYSFPADRRALRNHAAPARSNIIKYGPPGGETELPDAPDRRDPDRRDPDRRDPDILYIGEDTPAPPLTRRSPPRPRRQGDEDDGIFFIGDD